MSAARRPRRRRVAVVAAVVLVALAAGSVCVAYWQGYRMEYRPSPKGSPATELVPIPECALGPATLAQTRTHNVIESTGLPRAPAANPNDYDRAEDCRWGQVQGRDGVDYRGLRAVIRRWIRPDAATAAAAEYRTNARRRWHSVARPDITDVAGIGDEASYQTAVTGDGAALVTLTVRQGPVVIEVSLSARDQITLWNTPLPWTRPTPFPECERLTKLVAQELLAHPMS
ncbi:MAG: hypothetical protein HOQ24_16105 [Mycobacteriaceae bacterium]|nr:hypothetical protein [Mycobacteriaceae bacterium]